MDVKLHLFIAFCIIWKIANQVQGLSLPLSNLSSKSILSSPSPSSKPTSLKKSFSSPTEESFLQSPTDVQKKLLPSDDFKNPLKNNLRPSLRTSQDNLRNTQSANNLYSNNLSKSAVSTNRDSLVSTSNSQSLPVTKFGLDTVKSLQSVSKSSNLESSGIYTSDSNKASRFPLKSTSLSNSENLKLNIPNSKTDLYATNLEKESNSKVLNSISSSDLVNPPSFLTKNSLPNGFSLNSFTGQINPFVNSLTSPLIPNSFLKQPAFELSQATASTSPQIPNVRSGTETLFSNSFPILNENPNHILSNGLSSNINTLASSVSKSNAGINEVFNNIIPHNNNVLGDLNKNMLVNKDERITNDVLLLNNAIANSESQFANTLNKQLFQSSVNNNLHAPSKSPIVNNINPNIPFQNKITSQNLLRQPNIFNRDSITNIPESSYTKKELGATAIDDIQNTFIKQNYDKNFIQSKVGTYNNNMPDLSTRQTYKDILINTQNTKEIPAYQNAFSAYHNIRNNQGPIPVSSSSINEEFQKANSYINNFNYYPSISVIEKSTQFSPLSPESGKIQDTNIELKQNLGLSTVPSSQYNPIFNSQSLNKNILNNDAYKFNFPLSNEQNINRIFSNLIPAQYNINPLLPRVYSDSDMTKSSMDVLRQQIPNAALQSESLTLPSINSERNFIPTVITNVNNVNLENIDAIVSPIMTSSILPSSGIDSVNNGVTTTTFTQNNEAIAAPNFSVSPTPFTPTFTPNETKVNINSYINTYYPSFLNNYSPEISFLPYFNPIINPSQLSPLNFNQVDSVSESTVSTDAENPSLTINNDINININEEPEITLKSSVKDDSTEIKIQTTENHEPISYNIPSISNLPNVYAPPQYLTSYPQTIFVSPSNLIVPQITTLLQSSDISKPLNDIVANLYRHFVTKSSNTPKPKMASNPIPYPQYITPTLPASNTFIPKSGSIFLPKPANLVSPTSIPSQTYATTPRTAISPLPTTETKQMVTSTPTPLPYLSSLTVNVVPSPEEISPEIVIPAYIEFPFSPNYPSVSPPYLPTPLINPPLFLPPVMAAPIMRSNRDSLDLKRILELILLTQLFDNNECNDRGTLEALLALMYAT